MVVRRATAGVSSWSVCLSVCVAAILAGTDRRAAAADATEAQVLHNIFLSHCVVCHGKWQQQAGLDLRTRDAMLRGGDSGPALVPGDAEASLVYQRIARDEMPPKKSIFGEKNYVRRVHAADVDRLKDWIDAGTPEDGPAGTAEPPEGPVPKIDPLV